MNPLPQPIPLDEPAVQTPESITDVDSFKYFDEYINAELKSCKIRGRDGSRKSSQKIPRT